MAGLILIALVIVLVIGGIIAFLNGVKFWKILIAFVVILGSYHLYVSHTCGPNPKDVKVMKPMAEKIADYIVKHGIPESLKDIPDLPYALEGCEREEYSEQCNFLNYSVKLYQFTSMQYVLESFNKETETGISFYFLKEQNKIILENDGHPNPQIYSRKDDGICNPMRQ